MAIAHTGGGGGDDHDLDEHLTASATLAARFAEAWGARDWAELAALWHDLGKYAEEFQAKLAAVKDPDAHLEGQTPGGDKRVDHSSAGAQWAIERFDEVLGSLFAYVIAGHHGGLPDWRDDARTGLKTRLRMSDGLTRAKAAAPPEALLQKGPPTTPLPEDVDTALWVRFMASTVFDADFLDTEAYFAPERTATRLGAGWPPLPQMRETLTTELDRRFAGAGGPVNAVRAEVLAACRAKAALPPGLFSLTVPTGGGKTLASLSFALDHAVAHGKDRVIYAIPFTSIIEQTADVFRDILGPGTVLEHHSALEPSKDWDETNRTRLAAENWDAPLIVTTTVQLFESLFAARTSRVRKLHNLANSVLILDEAQALPPPVLAPITRVLDQLARHFNVTVVLCTATQPALHAVFKSLPEPTEIAPDPLRLFAALGRVEPSLPTKGETVAWPDLAAEVDKHDQALVIVNSRRDCRELHALLPAGAIHLSTWQCAAHRAELLSKIHAELKAGRPVRVVSTSLIEAGVDLDFPVVYRAMTGLDSLAQAAGRCNREGRVAEKGRFVVFRPEGARPFGHVGQAIQATEAALRGHPEAPLAPPAFDTYFRELYWAKGPAALDAHEMGRLLNMDAEPIEALRHGLQFRTAAEAFRMIDDTQETVVVPHGGKGREAIARLRREGPNRSTLRALQRFTVPVRKDCFERLRDAGAVEIGEASGGLAVLVRDKLYHPEIGLDCEAVMETSINELMV